MEIKFRGNDPMIKQLRADKGFRVEIEVSQDQYDIIKELPTPKFQDKNLEITIKEEEEV